MRQAVTLVLIPVALCLPESASTRESARSFDDLIGRAAANDPSALYALGSRFYLGEAPVGKDVDLAMHLFKMSSTAGSTEGRQMLVRQVEDLDRQYRQIKERVASMSMYDQEGMHQSLVDLCFTKSQRDSLDDFLYTSTGWESEKRAVWKSVFREQEALLAGAANKDQFFAQSREFALRTAALSKSVGEYTLTVGRPPIDYEQAYYRSYFRVQEALGVTREDTRENRKRGWLEFAVESEADAREVTSTRDYEAALERIKRRAEVAEELYGPLASAEVFEEAEWLSYVREISEKRGRFEVRDGGRSLSEEKSQDELIANSCKLRTMEVEARVLSRFLELFDG